MTFMKDDVDYLSQVFGKSCWEVADIMSEIVHAVDPDITNMYESGGRESQYRLAPHSMADRFHGYCQQLGWHALFLAAGQLLGSFPVTDDWWYDDPWKEWLGRYTLTRDDGLWLSDGTDRTPLDTHEFLLEPGKNGLAVTGDQVRILSLVGISGGRFGKELVVKGRWFSADHVCVEVSSALVSPKQASQLARRLIREDPMRVWLPMYHDSRRRR